MAGAYFLLAALVAFIGLRKVKQVRAPERAITQAELTAARFKRS
ncbi:MAG: hypothetical protein QM714_11840 [Nocardioides sp.]